MNPETMILRFRDLSTPEGDTLRLHQQEIDEHGFTWWAWWAKAGERIPVVTFGAFYNQARSAGGLRVWLFDSGRRQLYRAVLRDIEWHKVGERIQAPEKGEATPEYYRTASYPAWFKFSEIAAKPEAKPQQVLKQYAYVPVDEFFEQPSAGYGMFSGKRIASLEELREQERTIWFIARAAANAREHEIRMLHPHRASPSHFPEQFQQSASLNLLWLSDVHFSTTGHHAFPSSPTPTAKPLADRVQQACEAHVHNLGGIILSGDLAWAAEEEEFGQARRLLERLQTWGKLDNYQVAVCPGNHDVRFSDQPWEKGREITYAPDVAARPYATFYSEMFYLPPNDFLSCGRRYLLGGAVPVEVVCLNSSLLGQVPDVFQGHGFVGYDQMADAAQQMGWIAGSTEPRALRIVVVHHHLLPVTYREQPMAERSYSTSLDAEALLRWLVEHRVQVVLHGHMHSPFHTTLERPERLTGERHRVHVFGMGSSGVEVSHLGEDRKHLFGVLRLSREHLRMTYYSVDPTIDKAVEFAVIDVDL